MTSSERVTVTLLHDGAVGYQQRVVPWPWRPMRARMLPCVGVAHVWCLWLMSGAWQSLSGEAWGARQCQAHGCKVGCEIKFSKSSLTDRSPCVATVAQSFSIRTVHCVLASKWLARPQQTLLSLSADAAIWVGIPHSVMDRHVSWV